VSGQRHAPAYGIYVMNSDVTHGLAYVRRYLFNSQSSTLVPLCVGYENSCENPFETIEHQLGLLSFEVDIAY
jgi:hypothetical protein